MRFSTLWATSDRSTKGFELTENPRSSGGHNRALCPALEEDGLVIWSCTVCKRAHGEGGLILVCSEHIVESLMAKSLEEVFS